MGNPVATEPVITALEIHPGNEGRYLAALATLRELAMYPLGDSWPFILTAPIEVRIGGVLLMPPSIVEPSRNHG
jgi:hypothetical protein